MIRGMGILLASSGLLLASGQALALSVAASGGSDSFGIEASQAIAPGVRLGLGYLNTDYSGADAKVYSGSLMFFSPAMPVLDIAFGGRYQYQDTDFGSGGGFGLGGSVFVNTPIPTLSVGGYGFASPERLTHGDVQESYEYGLQARASLTSQIHVHGGYRYLRSDFTGTGTQTLHRGPVFGVSVGF